MEQKTRVFRQIDVQGFHLSNRNVLIRIRIRRSIEVLFLITYPGTGPEGTFYISLQRKKVIKKSQTCRSRCFPNFSC